MWRPATDYQQDLSGQILASYHLSRLALHDVVVTPDEQRMLGVATLIESPDGLQPHKARKERRIVGTPDLSFSACCGSTETRRAPIVYNIAQKVIER
jgi:hypothetical protein